MVDECDMATALPCAVALLIIESGRAVFKRCQPLWRGRFTQGKAKSREARPVVPGGAALNLNTRIGFFNNF